MSFLGKALVFFLEKVPYKFLVKNYHKFKNTIFQDFVDIAYQKRFFAESELINNFEKTIEKVKKSNKYCLIKKGIFDYKLLNFCFIKDMLSLVIWCVENGYKPIIAVIPNGGNYSDKEYLWSKMFLQPYNACAKEIISKGEYIECPITSFAIKPAFDDVFDVNKVSFWSQMLSAFAIFNNETKAYFDKEYRLLLKNKKVLGCICRGTDYVDTKPKGHYIQPDVERLLNEIGKSFEEGGFEYIYLATEEKRIADEFKKKFPNKILENQRMYFDEKYYNLKSGAKRISQVSFNRENDDFLKILEYTSSINLLSKCDSFIGGLCGGSQMAVYWNNGNYSICKMLVDDGKY